MLLFNLSWNKVYDDNDVDDDDDGDDDDDDDAKCVLRCRIEAKMRKRNKRPLQISALLLLDSENLISTPGANSNIYGICFRFLSYVLIIGLEEAKEILGAVIWHYCIKKKWSIFIGVPENRTAVQYKWALFTPDPVINSSSATECFNLCYRDTVSMVCTHDWPTVC